LTAKNLELQVSLKFLQEKADRELKKIKTQLEIEKKKAISKPQISASTAHMRP
jgi:hypothetical protein